MDSFQHPGRGKQRSRGWQVPRKRTATAAQRSQRGWEEEFRRSDMAIRDQNGGVNPLRAARGAAESRLPAWEAEMYAPSVDSLH
jgi:hypothetical protein